MWVVYIEDCKMNSQKFNTDAEAHQAMIDFLGDEFCPFENREEIRTQLVEAYLNRTQLKEGWGVYPYISAKWVAL